MWNGEIKGIGGVCFHEALKNLGLLFPFFLSLLYLLSRDRLEVFLFCANYKNHTDLRGVAHR